MKERPIIMGAESVRAILEGRKTQTRRIIRPQPNDNQIQGNGGRAWTFDGIPVHGIKCPYGFFSDRLWVRETVFFETFHQQSDEELKRDGFNPNIGVWVYRADNHDYPTITANWTSPMFMPRKASRITLEITDIRVERLQDISEEDAKAEGISREFAFECNGWVPSYTDPDSGGYADYIAAYRTLWNSLNTKRGYPWEKNPWVWVLTFKVVQ